MTNTSK